MFKEGMFTLVGLGFWESIYMTMISTFFAYIIGLPMGLILVMTDKEGVRPMPIVHQVLGIIINIIRSVPFLILLVTIMPFTKMVVGTVIGAKAAIVGLLVAAAPFVARLVESSLKEVEKGVVEAAQSMGASPLQILVKVLLPEAKPSLLVGSAIAVTTILGYSAMAGFIGGGGLGAIAINYGYHRGQRDIMYVMVVLLVIIVQVLQEVGMQIAKRTDKRL
ncbi:methionine ABC transporter permease [Anaerotignum sp. MB30-C6]|uniref:methionine ABC transporter permease n=1 Tax=Anaerotignum sp. MB30-C6 TaxID=3070814 RepID=UPI0027DD593D|nr:methionine ABC transporter permease [Anaerotignum sp. MB30-C6]WMI81057.1 methionine ABC transporter permease [Anaerotignum sp. MB30-C6]